MRTIYEPKGRAKEYSHLALNLYTGCNHGCTYCFNRKMPWYKEDVFNNPVPRPGILEALEKDCKKMRGDKRQILLCFTCDPYFDGDNSTTREALLILEKYEMNATVLTKGGMRAEDDFDILKRNGWSFGSTIITLGETVLSVFEPHAEVIEDRIQAIIEANCLGIKTWISLEPVVDPEGAINVIEELKPFVDFWKIGKWNHDKRANDIDWHQFYADVKKALGDRPHLIKEDLLRYANKELAR